MNNKSHFTTHSAAISALYLLGNGVILLPTYSADKFTVLAYLISVAITFAVYFILMIPANKIFSEPKECKSVFGKIALSIIFLAVAVFSLFIFAATFKIFVKFASDLLFKGELIGAATAIFAMVIFYFALHRQENILKFILLSFAAVFGIILFFFFASFNNFQRDNIIIDSLPDFGKVLKNLRPYIKDVSVPIIILPVYQALVFHKNRFGASLAGLTLGSLLLGICVTSAVLLFGSAFAAKIEYPYAAAVSTVSIGRLFTRMDYFSYFIYFASAVARITVCWFTVRECIKRIGLLLR